jgi:hypothetical protein
MISVEVAIGDYRNLLGLLSAVLGSNIVDNLVLDQVWLLQTNSSSLEVDDLYSQRITELSLVSDVE